MVMLGEAIVKIRTDDTDIDKSVANTKNKFNVLGGTLKTALGVAGGVGAVIGLQEVGRQIASTIDAASDLGETISKTDQVFAGSSAEIKKWAQGGAKDFGLSQQAALAAASDFGNMFNQLGVGTERSAELSTGMVELAADFASFHNADITQVLDAQSAAFRGEYDSLQRFLPLINAATVEQKALEMTGKASTKELTAQEKALAVNALMFEGAGKAAGDFDRTSEGLANRQRILQAEFANLQAKIGQQLLPVMVAIAGFILNEFIPAISDVAKEVQAFFKETEAGQTIFQGFITGVQVVIDVLQSLAKFVMENKEAAIALGVALGVLVTLMFPIPAAILAIVTAVGILSNNWDEIRAKTEEVWGAIPGPIQAALEFILQHVISKLQGIQQVFEATWQIISNIVSLFANLIQGDWSAAWQNLQNIATGVMNLLLGFLQTAFGQIPQIILSTMQQAVTYINDNWQQILNSVINFLTQILNNVISYFGQVLSSVTTSLTNLLNTVINFMTVIVNNVVNFFSQLPGIATDYFSQMVGAISSQLGNAQNAARSIAEGVINTIRDIFNGLFNLGREGVQQLLDGFRSLDLGGEIRRFVEGAIPGAIRSLLGIGSPSKVLFDIGRWITQGLINGIKNKLPSLASAAAAVKGVIWNALSGVGGAVTDAFGNAVDAAGNVVSSIGGFLGIGGGGGSRGVSGNVESWRGLVSRYFPANQVDNALRIIQAESGGNASIISPVNRNGTRDVGLFQINDVHGLSTAARQDPETNVRFAAQLFARSGWQPWSTAPKLGLAAEGANTRAGVPWIVGERGFELFVPNQAGTILSHDDTIDALSRANGMQVNMPNATILARDENEARETAGNFGWQIRLRTMGVMA